MATKTTCSAEINKAEVEILSITNLATKTTLNAVENIIPSVSNLVKETDYNPKINEIEKKLLIIIMITILLLQNLIS